MTTSNETLGDSRDTIEQAFARHRVEAISDWNRHSPPSCAEVAAWQPMKDAPTDGTTILVWHRIHGVMEGYFSPGSWSDDTPISPREYSGDVWVLGDDLIQEEVECGPDGFHASSLLGWLPFSSLHPDPQVGVELRQAQHNSTEAVARIDADACRLAVRIVEALEKDEQDGGFDLAAGIFGSAFSALVVELSRPVGKPVAWFLEHADGTGPICRDHPGEWPNCVARPLYVHPDPQVAALTAELDRKTEALEKLEQAATIVARVHADHRPQWSKLYIALFAARAALTSKEG